MEKKATHRKPEGHYHHGDLRKAIIETALEIVDTEGIGSLTLRAVSLRLGVSHAAPVYHFPSRAALILALAEEGFRLFADELERAYSTEPSDGIRLVGRAYLQFALSHKNHYRIMFGPELTAVPNMTPSFLAESERAFAVLSLISGDALDGGLSKKSLYLWSVAHGLVMLKLGPLLSRASAEDEPQLLSLMDQVMLEAVSHLSEMR